VTKRQASEVITELDGILTRAALPDSISTQDGGTGSGYSTASTAGPRLYLLWGNTRCRLRRGQYRSLNSRSWIHLRAWFHIRAEPSPRASIVFRPSSR